MFTDRKIYKIKGTTWEQRDLLYHENELVRPLMKDKFNSERIANGQIGELFDDIYSAGILKPLFKVVLKPYGRSRFQRWRNARRMAALKIQTGDDLLQYMTDSEIAKVLIDFFIYRTRWITNSLGLRPTWSFLSIRWISKLRNLITSRNPLSSLPDTTSPKSTPSKT